MNVKELDWQEFIDRGQIERVFSAETLDEMYKRL